MTSLKHHLSEHRSRKLSFGHVEDGDHSETQKSVKQSFLQSDGYNTEGQKLINVISEVPEGVDSQASGSHPVVFEWVNVSHSTQRYCWLRWM